MIDPNEPASPVQFEEEYGDHGRKLTVIHKGLTKREFFASVAMQGMLANSYYAELSSSQALKDLRQGDADEIRIDKILGERCVQMADALIEELNK